MEVEVEVLVAVLVKVAVLVAVTVEVAVFVEVEEASSWVFPRNGPCGVSFNCGTGVASAAGVATASRMGRDGGFGGGRPARKNPLSAHPSMPAATSSGRQACSRKCDLVPG